MSERLSETLDRAADLIEERGWAVGLPSGSPYYCKNPWGEGEYVKGAPLCLEGGILAATGMTNPSSDAFHSCPAYRAMQEYLGLKETDLLFGWNDKRGRTPEEVIDALRGAAEKHRLIEEEVVESE